MDTMIARSRNATAAPWIALAAALAAETAPAAPAVANPVIEDGATVRIEYTLKDGAGAVLDSTKEREPLRYTHGQQQILPGLEKELKGLQAGQEKKVTLPPEEAYGAVDPAAQT